MTTEALQTGRPGSTALLFLLAENRLLRETLLRILSEKGDLKVSGAISASPGVVAVLSQNKPEIILVDSSSLATQGRTLIGEIRRALPKSRLILIGMESDSEIFFQAVRDGVVGYVLKDASAAEMVNVIRAVASGEAVCPPCFSQAIFNFAAQHLLSIPVMDSLAHGALSRREQQLVSLVGLSLTNKEIAARLHLSEYTVKNHMHRIFCKLGVHDRSSMLESCRISSSPNALPSRNSASGTISHAPPALSFADS